MKESKLILLGIWNILPLQAWAWFADAAVAHFRKLTGRSLGVFTYVKDDLHYECFTAHSVNLLRQDFERLSPAGQVRYVQRLTDDYYRQAKKLLPIIEKLERINFRSLSNRVLAQLIKKFENTWTKVTKQVWFAVILDIWYPSPKEQVAVKSIVAKLRDDCGRDHSHSIKVAEKMYQEAARRLGMSLHGVYYLFPEEIVKALKSSESLESLAHERMQFCLTTNVSGQYKIYSGKEARALLRRYNPPSIGTKKQKLLIGTSAQPGVVRGRVRKILLDKDFSKFKSGEILVTLQTMVHYLPLMRKAKAIITEFGGLTSHAAIVSRELNKPCIVGIKNLIASFKDGDKVEVDAERGIIRKL